MTHSRWIMGAAAILLAAGCTKGPRPMSNEERVALADSIDQLVMAQAASLAQGVTPEKVRDLYVPGDDVVVALFGTIIPSNDSLMKLVNASYPAGTKLKLTLQQKRVTVLDRDLVAFTSLMDQVSTDSTGKERFRLTGAWTLVYQRTPAGWKVAINHTSAPLPAPAPARKPARRTR